MSRPARDASVVDDPHAEAPVAAPQFDEAFKSLLTELFRWRRDVRRFRSEPLDSAVVEELVQLATLAPSVGHSQPWRFVSVEDESRRAAVIDSFNRCNAAALSCYDGEMAALYARLKLEGLKDAPVHLAVFCETKPAAGHGLGRMTMPETLAYSVVGAVQNLALAARARGLGVGWVSIIEPAAVTAILDVPVEWQFLAYLCIGWPQEEHVDPELERHGWQARLPQAALLHRR